MGGTIIIENVRNGAKSPMSVEQWDRVQADPYWKGVFKAHTPPVPPEVVALKEKQASGLKPQENKN